MFKRLIIHNKNTEISNIFLLFLGKSKSNPYICIVFRMKVDFSNEDTIYC